MSTGIVKFKFKHQNVFDKIEFQSSEITVAELRIKIQEKLLMDSGGHRNTTVLEILKLGTEEPYEWDHELIPSHTSVLVTRVPSRATKKIVIDSNQQLFATESQGHEDYFALKPSIIQSEIDSIRRVPQVVVCSSCGWLMVRPAHSPVILACCGYTVCHECGVKAGSACPIEKRDIGKPIEFVTDRATERIVNVVSSNKAAFAFDSVSIPEDFLQVQAEPQAAVTDVEIVDVDSFEPEVFDVDNPRPLSAKEIEAIDRRERRKRKALEILAKREGAKAVKGELTEADVNRLLKMELKAELDGTASGQDRLDDDASDSRRRPIVVEFPKLLTPEEFNRWKSQL